MIIYYALGTAVVSLVVGLGVLLLIIFRAPRVFNTFNIISWLLIAMVPVFPLFAIFPDSSFTLKFKTITAGGAAALFVFIWLKGVKFTREAYDVDQLKATITQSTEQIAELKEQLKKPEEADPETLMYCLKNGKKVGLIAGDIMNVKSADIWVSSENTNMEMARFFDRSVSAVIRYYGAKRSDDGRVIVERDKDQKIISDGDLIAEELRTRKGHEFYVQPGSVFVTGPGELATSNNVKRIFHVAAVHGTPRDGYRPVPKLDECVKKVLSKAKDFSYKSILLPLLATGTAKGEVESISRGLIKTAVTELENDANHILDTVFFLAWSKTDQKTCEDIFAEFGNRIKRC